MGGRQRRRALDRLARLRDEADVAAHLSWRRARSAAAGLHEVVRGHADLLVVGASRRDDYEWVATGDDARDVLDDPPSAVAVAPPGHAARSREFGRIGVAYDGSAASEGALVTACRLAGVGDTELSVFQAVPEPICVHDPWHVEAEIAAGVEDARASLAGLGGVTATAASGDPVEELARFAESVDRVTVRPPRQACVSIARPARGGIALRRPPPWSWAAEGAVGSVRSGVAIASAG